MSLKLEKVCLTTFMFLLCFSFLFSAFPALHKFLSFLQTFQILLFVRVRFLLGNACCLWCSHESRLHAETKGEHTTVPVHPALLQGGYKWVSKAAVHCGLSKLSNLGT